MKKIFCLVLLGVLLTGCAATKEVSSDQELIKIADVDGKTIYLASPSEMILIASGSEMFPYVIDGKVMHLKDFEKLLGGK